MGEKPTCEELIERIVALEEKAGNHETEPAGLLERVANVEGKLDVLLAEERLKEAEDDIARLKRRANYATAIATAIVIAFPIALGIEYFQLPGRIKGIAESEAKKVAPKIIEDKISENFEGTVRKTLSRLESNLVKSDGYVSAINDHLNSINGSIEFTETSVLIKKPVEVSGPVLISRETDKGYHRTRIDGGSLKISAEGTEHSFPEVDLTFYGSGGPNRSALKFQMGESLYQVGLTVDGKPLK